LVTWCLEAFAAADSIERIVIAAPPGHEAEVEAIAGGAEVVTGAEARSASVANALDRVETELVAVHDAARPLVTAELIDAVVAKLAGRSDAAGVIAAAAVMDTVKRAHEPRPARGAFERGGPTVAGTESRDHLWVAQTPQAFRTDVLREALAADPQRVAVASDDAMLVEQAGGKVLIEPAPASNLKVTTADDLRVAATLLG
jgi:2-C-methyl-D-erythritol 4-phosphate cytidylyltransferase